MTYPYGTRRYNNLNKITGSKRRFLSRLFVIPEMSSSKLIPGSIKLSSGQAAPDTGVYNNNGNNNKIRIYRIEENGALAFQCRAGKASQVAV